MLATPTQYHTFVIHDDTGQKTRLFCLTTTSIVTEILIGPQKILIGSYTDLNADSCSGLNLNIDSGSCSGLKSKLRQESTPILLCQAKFLTSRHAKFLTSRHAKFLTSRSHAQTNILHIKYVEKSDEGLGFRV